MGDPEWTSQLFTSLLETLLQISWGKYPSSNFRPLGLVGWNLAFPLGEPWLNVITTLPTLAIVIPAGVGMQPNPAQWELDGDFIWLFVNFSSYQTWTWKSAAVDAVGSDLRPPGRACLSIEPICSLTGGEKWNLISYDSLWIPKETIFTQAKLWQVFCLYTSKTLFVVTEQKQTKTGGLLYISYQLPCISCQHIFFK